MEVIQAVDAANQSKNFTNKIKKNKEESERKYKIFLEQSGRVFNAINKQINERREIVINKKQPNRNRKIKKIDLAEIGEE